MLNEYLQSDNSIDIVSPDISSKDYELFFGPLDENAKPLIKSFTNIGDILLELGLVPSRSWCRQNNWSWSIPDGYTEVRFGKKKVKICILIKFPNLELESETRTK